MTKFYVYPVKNDNIVKGFCPTLCDADSLAYIVGKMYMDCVKFRIKFDEIKVVEK